MKKHIVFSLFSVLALSAYAQQTCKPNIQATTPDSRFTTTAETVTDTKTGLMWMRCGLWQLGNDCSGGSATQYNWQQALEFVAVINAASLGGYNDWRLPNIQELASIAELRCIEPAINLTIFPNTPIGRYWSSSPHAYYRNEAWSLDFDYGARVSIYKTNSYFVRLVRDL